MLCLQCFISSIKNHFHESPGRALIEHEKVHFHQRERKYYSEVRLGRKIQSGSKVDMSVVIWRSNQTSVLKIVAQSAKTKSNRPLAPGTDINAYIN